MTRNPHRGYPIEITHDRLECLLAGKTRIAKPDDRYLAPLIRDGRGEGQRPGRGVAIPETDDHSLLGRIADELHYIILNVADSYFLRACVKAA